MKIIRWVAAALLATGSLVMWSCTDSATSLTAPRTSESSADLLGGLLGPTGLVYCAPLPADSASQLIGPDGGSISVGPHTLVVPAGALDSTVLISARAPSGWVNRVTFQPHGLVFQQPALLTMSYANCGLLTQLLPKHIAYIDNFFRILDLLPSRSDDGAQTITGHLQHFSDYAVAW